MPDVDAEGTDHDEWEALGEHGDQVICPGCLTGVEEQAIYEDGVLTALAADELREGVGTMKQCPRCHGDYDERSNDGDGCMSCQALSQLASGGVASLDDLPLHEVVEEGINLIGQRYVRLRYADGSLDLIDPIPWDETIGEVAGHVARDDEDLS